ncbi:MAG: sigma-70 family RNA polymerase sigma factor [Rubricoccaceae bacterium]
MASPDALLLTRTRAGDADALDQLVDRLYGELRHIAQAQRRRLGAPDTLNTTAVVHEVYAKLDGRQLGVPTDAPDQFLYVAARAMRDVIVDYARAQNTAKRGGSERPLTLHGIDTLPVSVALDPVEVLAVDRALNALERIDALAARVTELRYFAGLTIAETAETLDLSPMTVKRRWALARAWLYDRLVETKAAA